MVRADPAAKLSHGGGARSNRLDRWGMNRPDKPGELSIDEILASIRQNSSEEPDASRSAALAPLPEPPPVVPTQAAPPPELPPSLQERLNGTFNKGASADTPSAEGANGMKRPLPFDQDLADILDEPDAASVASAAPKPEIRVSPELGATAAARPQAAATPAAAEPSPAAAAPSVSPPPASPSPTAASAPAAPLAAPPAFGRAFADSAAAPRPQAFGFPPLTKREGFYPAERPEPVLPPVRSDNLVKPAPLNPSPAPSLSGAGASLDRVSPNEPASRFPDFGSVVPSDVAGRSLTPESAFGAPPRAGSGAAPHGGMNGLSLRPPQLDGPELAPSLDRAAGSPALPPAAPSVVANPTLPEPVTASVAPKPDAAPIAAPPAARPAAAAPAPKPTGQSTVSSAAETVDKDAAANALGALAQGLAASTAKTDAADVGVSPPQERAAAPGASPQAAAPVSPAPVSPALAAAPVAVQSASDASAAPGRTLEDVVADMLRPMLQKWVAENMPRIMEKALRSEMQRTLGAGGGTKPPGS